MIKWRDISSYSQGDKVRTPHSFEARAGGVRIVVTRRHGCDGWFLNCDPWFSLHEMGEMSADEAKRVGTNLVRSAAKEFAAAMAD